jgi:regulator of sigma E protease
MVIFQNLWWLLVLIGVMILIHELGHYWAARFFNVRVETFSFGFGPRLFGFRRGETDFRFSAILFGGYVKMSGEQPGEEAADDPHSLAAKPRWQRLIIVFAGPAMNIILAVVLLTGLFMVQYPKIPNADPPVTIGHIAADSPASRAGVREGDRIVRLDDQPYPNWEDIFMKEVAGIQRPIHLVLERNGQNVLASVTPIMDEKTGAGYVGWSAQAEIRIAGTFKDNPAEKAGLRRGDILLSVNGQIIRSTQKLQAVLQAANGGPVEIMYSRKGDRNKVTVEPVMTNLEGQSRWWIGVSLEPRVIMTKLSFPEAVRASVERNIRGATLIYQFLRGIIERRMSPRSLEGPIRIAQLSGEAAREGAAAFIDLMALVSLNLAVFNLLPIPILDGGVILMLLIEMLMRRDLSLQVKEAVLKVGFVFLMAVVAFVIYNDISKIL